MRREISVGGKVRQPSQQSASVCGSLPQGVWGVERTQTEATANVLRGAPERGGAREALLLLLAVTYTVTPKLAAPWGARRACAPRRRPNGTLYWMYFALIMQVLAVWLGCLFVSCAVLCV